MDNSDDSWVGDKSPVPLSESVERIIRKTEKWRSFWPHARGWAPAEAADLLSKSRLDLQVELAHCLKDWTSGKHSSLGHLVLAWANLGALVEGSMMLMCCVYYEDYKRHAEGRLAECSPDQQSLDLLRAFFAKHIWFPEQVTQWNPWILKVQQRRNAIHAFRDRQLGDFDEFAQCVREYCDFVAVIDERLPYPN